MALYTFDAIEIISNDGTGSPVAYTDADTGFASGIFRARTGRFAIGSVSGDTAVTLWYTGILNSQGITGGVSADFETVPKMSSTTGFSFGIVNADGFFADLEAAGVDLINCVAKHYHARSTDGSAWAFYLRQTGIVDSVSRNENTFSVRCIAAPKGFLSSLPKEKIDSVRFPNSPEDSRDKVLPIVLGRVPYSPFTMVEETSELMTLCRIDGVDYNTAAVLSQGVGFSGPYGIKIKTNGLYFPPNSSELVGKYFRIVNGGVDQTRYITGCYAWPNEDATELMFDDPLDLTTPMLGWAANETSPDVTYLTVSSYQATAVAASHEVHSIHSDASGRTKIYQYSTDTKRYTDVSQIQNSSSTSGVGITGLPGVAVAANSSATSGDFTTYHPITPASVEVASTDDLTFITGSVANLTDADRDTVMTWARFNSVSSELNLEVELPDITSLGSLEDLYLIFDIAESTTLDATRAITAAIDAYDMYGRRVDLGLSTTVVSSILQSGSTNYIYGLPNKYYGDGETESEEKFHALKASLSIIDFVNNDKAGRAYNRFLLTFTFPTFGGVGTHSFSLLDVGFVAKVQVNYSSEPIHSHIIGAKFAGTWASRRTADDPVLLAGDMIEKVVRDFESSPTSIDTTAFDLLRTTDRPWAYGGRTIDENTKTEQVLEGLAREYFIGLRTNRSGQLSPIAFLEQGDPVATFDETNSWDGSGITPTSKANVFTEIDLMYGYDYGTKTFNARLFVTKTEESAFPNQDETLSPGAELSDWQIIKVIYGSSYYYVITFDDPHGFTTAPYIHLTGNLDGYDFPPTQSTLMDAVSIYVPGTALPTGYSTTGDLYMVTDTTLKWPTYVGGIANYAQAKSLWERFRANYLVLKTKNAAPEDIAKCYWLIDQNLRDLDGNLIWSDIASQTTMPAYEYALRVANWSSVVKEKVSFSVNKTVANLALNVYDKITFSDDANTVGAQSGFIEEVMDVPTRGPEEKEHLRITMIFIPSFVEELPNRIIDSAGNDDRIIDTADASDRIIDTPQ